MRGKAYGTAITADGKRITPAYAGKSFTVGGSLMINWDHPRVCGEKAVDIAHERRLQGSPPRMRGKEHPGKYPALLVRITPAYAGKRGRIP